MSIVFENVSYTYDAGGPQAQSALQDVSLVIDQGEFVGIIGHTGSGKSTLVQHINALLQPTAGKVTVDGISLAEKTNRREVRAKVGLVFQYPEYQLFEETVEKDIAFGPRNLRIPEEQIQQKVLDSLQLVGLDPDILLRSPFELSGGQKRRVALAGVLATQTPILMLDEPTAGLDPEGRAETHALLKSLNKQGHTILLISHSMDDIASLCSRVLVLEKGKIVMDDTPQNVFREAKKLLDMGLDVPETVALATACQAKGLQMASCLSVDELAQTLLAMGKEARA